MYKYVLNIARDRFILKKKHHLPNIQLELVMLCFHVMLYFYLLNLAALAKS